jgi:hypothetical protein
MPAGSDEGSSKPVIFRRRQRLAVNVDLSARIATVGGPYRIELAVGGGFAEELGLQDVSRSLRTVARRGS